MIRRKRVAAAAAAGLGGLAFFSLSLMGAGPSAPPSQGQPESGTANIWVDTNGGTCADNASLVAYSDAAACASFDAAWDAAEAGDLIRVRPGTYAEQIVSGDKASETRIVGDGDGDDVIVGDGGDGADCPVSGWSAFCADGNFMTLENVTTVVSDPGPAGGLKVDGTNVTVRNFHTIGDTGQGVHCPDGPCMSTIGVEAIDFTFDGGSIGTTAYTEEKYCDGSDMQPIWFQSGGDNAVIDGVEVGTYDMIPGSPGQGICGGDATPHMESVRLEDADNVTIKNSVFHGPSEAGSGHFFSSADPDNLTVINTVFEDRGLANNMIQCNGCTGDAWVFLYNTILDEGGAAKVPHTMAGNFGYTLGCGATANVKNVWEGSGSCGSNAYIGATAFGLDANNRLQAGSPAVDAAETPGASDHCTDAATVNSLDREGDARPSGSVCDAGADER